MKYTLLLAIISALALTVSLNQPIAAQGSNPPSLAGSWQLTLSQTNPTPSTAEPIEGLVTFTTDGSLVETDAAEISLTPTAATRAGASGTPGHGIWQAGPAFGNYYVQFVSLLITPLGRLQARRAVTITGNLDSSGNNFAGNYSAQIFDPAGHVTGTTSGTVAAAKMVHPLLP